jgi:ribosomal RNA small subunit methyltransferase A
VLLQRALSPHARARMLLARSRLAAAAAAAAAAARPAQRPFLRRDPPPCALLLLAQQHRGGAAAGAARRHYGAARQADPPMRGRPREPSAALKTARVALRKRFGQHFHKNPDVVRNIVAAAAIQPDETVFEIGPGSGNMTVHLLEKARVLYAVELDARLHAVVTARVAALGLGHKFQCLRADFLAAPLPPFDALVANIPYQISSPVLARFFAHTPPPKRAVLMLQKEFAERLVARPSTADYCRLTVNTQLLCGAAGGGSVRLLLRVGREQFRPPPKVDSAVAELVPRAGGWGAIVAAWPPLPPAPVAAAGAGVGAGVGAGAGAHSGGAARLWALLAARCSSGGGGGGDPRVVTSHVDSARGRARPPPPPPTAFAFEDWDGFLRVCFGGKNKTLRAIFSNKNTLRDVWERSAAAPACAAALAAVPAPLLRAVADEEAEQLAGATGGARTGGSGRDGHDDGDDDDEAREEEAVDVAACDESEPPGTAAAPPPAARRGARRSSHAAQQQPPSRDDLARLRVCVHVLLGSLGLSDRRPNALSVGDYQLLYRALAQGAGLSFAAPPAPAPASSIEGRGAHTAALFEGGAPPAGGAAAAAAAGAPAS